MNKNVNNVKAPKVFASFVYKLAPLIHINDVILLQNNYVIMQKKNYTKKKKRIF